jgi:tetratricopeptide (TPR) repeat protein
MSFAVTSAARVVQKAQSLPQPFRRSLELVGELTSDLARHDQILFAFGSLLRLLTSILCARYLRQEGVDLEIEQCIATNMRRPALSHHVDFLRKCARSAYVDWGPASPLAAELANLLNKKSGLLDSLLGARNRTFHGARVMAEETARGLLPGLAAKLAEVIEELPALESVFIREGESPELELAGKRMALMPLAAKGEGPRIGLLEGWKARQNVLRFVDADSDWETDRGWHDWAQLLRKRSLLPTALEEVTELWLRSRALAMRSSVCQWPETGPLASELLADASRFGTLTEWPAHDPWLAAAALALLGESQGRIVFILTSADARSGQDAVGIFSETLGIDTSLDTLPPGHHLENILSKVDVVLVLPPPGQSHQWCRIAKLFSGLRVLSVFYASCDGVSFRALGDLAHKLLEWRLQKVGVSAPKLLEDTKLWAGQMAGIHTLIESLAAKKDVPHSLFSYWRALIRQFVPDEERTGALALDSAAFAEWVAVDRDIVDALHAGGAISMDQREGWAWCDPWARFAAMAEAFERGLPERVACYRLDQVDSSPDIEVASSISTILTHRGGCLAAHTVTRAWLLASKAVQARSNPALELKTVICKQQDPLPVLRRAARLLISWERPDAVNLLLECSSVDGGDPEMILELACLARRSGGVLTAIRFLTPLASASSQSNARALHEMAGVLRDQGSAESREKAAEIYAALLERRDISPEQRLRTLCGTAENLVWLGKADQAHRYLDEANRLAPQIGPLMEAMVHHRRAFVHLHAGDVAMAMKSCESALALLRRPLSGPLAARILDTASRALDQLGRSPEAQSCLEESLGIKRSYGDRLGLQKGLLNLSLLRQHRGADDAECPALQALRMAERAADINGQMFAHRRLAAFYRIGDQRRTIHRDAATRLQSQLKGQV